MAEVVLFHHAQGVTDGVEAFADNLRQAGHVVHTPNLYVRGPFATFEEGVRYAFNDIGLDGLVKRAELAVHDLPTEVVYAGISLGVMPAQMFAQTREGARGVLLFHSFVPHTAFGSWPQDLPGQIHAMEDDPIFNGSGDLESAWTLRLVAPDVEVFLYPGDGHIFTDSTTTWFDAEASALVMERVLAFLDAC
jgi:dienelactone hydrolase